jgi:hypothetical protein
MAWLPDALIFVLFGKANAALYYSRRFDSLDQKKQQHRGQQ